MITVIEGPMGTGKTLILAKLAKADLDRGRKVYALAPFAFEGWEEFSLDLLGSERLRDCSIYLDTPCDFLDSHRTMSKTNTLMAYLTSQYRKRLIDLYISVPNRDLIDKRVRRLVTTRICCGPVSDGKGQVSIVDESTGDHTEVEIDLVGLYPLVEGYQCPEEAPSRETLDFIKRALKE